MLSKTILYVCFLIFGRFAGVWGSGATADLETVCSDSEFDSYAKNELAKAYSDCGINCNATVSSTCQQCNQAHADDCSNSCENEIDNAVDECLKCSDDCDTAVRKAIYEPCYWRMQLDAIGDEVTVLEARLVVKAAETCTSPNWGYIFALIFGAIGGSLVGTFLFAASANRISHFYSKYLSQYISQCCGQVSKWIPFAGGEEEEEAQQKLTH